MGTLGDILRLVTSKEHRRAFMGGAAETVGAAGKEAKEALMGAVAPGRFVANHSGERGQHLMMMLEQIEEEKGRLVGRAMGRLNRTLRNRRLGEMENRVVVDYIEGKNPHVGAEYKAIGDAWSENDRELADWAESLELPMFDSARYWFVYNKSLQKFMAEGIPQGEAHIKASAQAGSKARGKFRRLEHHFPHYYSESTALRMLAPDNPVRAEVLKGLEAGGLDHPTAVYLYERLLRAPGEVAGGPLQHVRNWHLPGYETNIMGVAERYYEQSYKRLLLAKHFGVKHELAESLINEVGLEKGTERARWLKVMYNAYADQADPRYRTLAKVTGWFHNVTMLSTAGIVQPTQLINTVMVGGWMNAFKSAAQVIQDFGGAKAFALESGALIPSISADFTVGGLDDIGRMWARVIGLEQLDRFNRVFSAVAGRVYLQNVSRRFLENPTPFLARELEKLGMSPHQLRFKGNPDYNDLLKAGRLMANDTQFASTVFDMPLMRATPWGPFLYRYKSFAYQQAMFVHRRGFHEATRNGNYLPLIRMLAGIPIAAMALGPLVRMAKGREKPDSDVEEFMQSLAFTGGLAGYADILRAMGSGPSAIANLLIGPTGGELTQVLGSDIPALFGPLVDFDPDTEPNTLPITRHAISRIPGVGQYIRNTWFPLDQSREE